MVELPGHYRWSSFCHNIGVKKISFLSPHAIYQALGNCEKARQKAYQSLFKGHVDEVDLKRIREAWQTGTPLGNDWFGEKVERQLQCKVGCARRGRPRKTTRKGL